MDLKWRESIVNDEIQSDEHKPDVLSVSWYFDEKTRIVTVFYNGLRYPLKVRDGANVEDTVNAFVAFLFDPSSFYKKGAAR